MARTKLVYLPYVLSEIVEKISKFDIRHIGLNVSTYYDGRIISNVEVSERYWSFDFKTFSTKIINQITNYFKPATYSLRINRGAQEIRIIGEEVMVKDEKYYKMFNLINSSDKTRVLQMTIGLVREKTNVPIVISVDNENASVTGKHYFKSLPEKLEFFLSILPEFNIIIDKQVAILRILDEKTVSLKAFVTEFLRKDEDGILLPADVMRFRMFVKKLVNSSTDGVPVITPVQVSLLQHPSTFLTATFDLNINAKGVLNLYTEIYKNYDSSVVESETRRVYKILSTL